MTVDFASTVLASPCRTVGARALVGTIVALAAATLGCTSEHGRGDAGMADAAPPHDGALRDADVRGFARDLCRELSTDYAATIVACWGEPRAEETYASSYSCNGLEDLAEEIARGWLAYDAAAMDRCHAEWRAAVDCNPPHRFVGGADARETVDACPGALVGQQEIDDPCTTTRDCVTGATCIRGSDCIGLCRPFATLGEACDDDATCESPLLCLGSVCTAPGGLGDDCERGGDGWSICRADQLWCDPASNSCVALITAADGEACGLGAQCEDGLHCYGREDGTATCAVPTAAGGACSLTYPTCDRKRRCVPDGVSSTSGVCGRLAPGVILGERCDPPPDFGIATGPFCAWGRCVGHICTARTPTRSACTMDFDCRSGSCVARHCVDPVACLTTTSH